MKKYKIPLIWEMGYTIQVEATSLKDAIKKLKEMNLPQEIKKPIYREGSLIPDWVELELLDPENGNEYGKNQAAIEKTYYKRT